MTDQPDRQDGDGLLAADELFESAVLAAMHATLSSAVIEAMTAMVRDADAGLSIQRATLPTILFAKEILATCASPPTRDGASGAGGITIPLCESFAAIGWDISERDLRKFEGALFRRGLNIATLTAPPKPAPDAMREALRVIGTMAICEDGETAEQRELIVDACRDVALQALSAPVPPANGALELGEREAARCGGLQPGWLARQLVAAGERAAYMPNWLTGEPNTPKDRIHPLLKQLAFYYDVNDCQDRDDDDALEVPIRDLKEAKEIFATLSRQAPHSSREGGR